MPNKKQHIIKLIGFKADGTKANIREAGQVTSFQNSKKSIRVTHEQPDIDTDLVIVTTADGCYVLQQHDTIINMYMGVLANGIKAHFTKKKLVAKLIYWV